MPDVEMTCVQCKEVFFFYGERAGNFLRTKYDAATEMYEMPLEKSSDRRERANPF